VSAPPAGAPASVATSDAEAKNLDAAGDAAEAGATKAKKEGAQEEQEDAEAPPLSGFRGGTLGFPSTGATGVVAAATLQNQGAPFDTGILAKAASLDLTTFGSLRLSADVLAELVQADVPFAEYAIGTRPLPKLVGADLVSLGFRLQLSPSRTADLAAKRKEYEQGFRRRFSECATLRKNAPPQPGSSCGEFEKKFKEARTGNGYDADKVEEIVASELLAYETNHLRGFSVAPGVRYLYRKAEETGEGAAGIAAEVSVQYAWASGAAFLSGAFLYLGENETREEQNGEGLAKVQEAVTEAKATAGYYWEGRRKNKLLAPRVGAYYSFYRNWWDNRFAQAPAKPAVSGYQHEGAVFLSGTFSNGVSGLFSFGARRPYGADSQLEFLFSFSPAFGDQVGKAEAEKEKEPE
jgi:hypothetical protein